MKVAIIKETIDGETRVAATPETVKNIKKLGVDVVVEPGAGEASFIADSAYEEAGATIAKSAADAYDGADILLKVRHLSTRADIDGKAEVDLIKEGAVVIGFLAPFEHDDTIRQTQKKKLSTLAMELVPRITRAQKMDALSSQASIAGYKAVLLAAAELPKYFPMLMTAAGTVKPAHVVVMGAGVAGLQAIATAKRLGAVVEATDVRPAVKEQVESLGGKFIDIDLGEAGVGQGGYAKELTKEDLARQQEIIAEHVAKSDVVITTALIPGRKAPVLVPKKVVERMKAGAVIVDLAAGQGGNCEVSKADENVRHNGVLVVGHTNLPATMPADASMLYARNVLELVKHIVKDGACTIDVEDEITGQSLIAHDGKVIAERVKQRLGDDAADKKEGEA